MSYQATVGSAVNLLHPVSDAAGVGYVTGQASNLTTALLDPAGASSALTISITEVGSTGLYKVSLTPTSAGLWFLTITNPAGTDEQTAQYVISAVESAAAGVSADHKLTTLARVKQRMEITAATWDDLLEDTIKEVSEMVQRRLGRWFAEATYTEYHAGAGQDRLYLTQGPLVSVSSLSEVTYSDDGLGNRVETLDTVPQSSYVEGGKRTEECIGRGWIELLGQPFDYGSFYRGQRNYKVVYAAGFDVIPEDLQHFTVNWVVSTYLSRRTFGLSTKDINDATQTPLPPDSMIKAIDRDLAHYRTADMVIG